MEKEYKTFKEFYPFYIKEHSQPMTKLMHFIGSSLGLVVLAFCFMSSFKYLILAPLIGYLFAWLSHFFIEKNRPATFKYPLFSFMGDWVMFWEILKGKHRIL